MRQPFNKLVNKLVRDRIPSLIEANGQTCGIETLTADEYRQALRDKLCEEAAEAAAAHPNDLITELADLSEVMVALMATYGISPEAVRKTQMIRKEERGGFRQRIRLLWTQSQKSQAE